MDLGQLLDELRASRDDSPAARLADETLRTYHGIAMSVSNAGGTDSEVARLAGAQLDEADLRWQIVVAEASKPAAASTTTSTTLDGSAAGPS